MTRFARAKGSKSSNQKIEEEATPWSQLVEGIKSNELTQSEDLIDDQYIAEDVNINENTVTEDLENIANFDDKELKFDDKSINNEDKSNNLEAQKKKQKVRCRKCGTRGHLRLECPDLLEEEKLNLQKLLPGQKAPLHERTLKKRLKTNLRRQKKKLQKVENNVDLKRNEANLKKNKMNNQKKFQSNVKKLDRSGAAIEKGEGTFQGFRVRKEDMKRLLKLHKSLVKRGATKEEIKTTLKQERRKAEKELARFKSSVCYNCRKPGHVLSACPVATKEDSLVTQSSGICFKCGSTEHISKNCNSHKSKQVDYSFASCFICKKQGHIAKLCPENPKGLYPNGGGCRFCGSVTHLKRDCKRKIEKDERDQFKLARIDATVNSEEIYDEQPGKIQKTKLGKEKYFKKIVKF